MFSTPRNWPRLATLVCLLMILLQVVVEARLSSTRDLAADCEKTCQNPQFKDLQHFEGDDLMEPQALLTRLKARRQQWIQSRLKKDYGPKNYQNMFEPMADVLDPATNKTSKQRISVGRNRIFTDGSTLMDPKKDIPTEGIAWDRFVSKLQMKVLQTQLAILEERQNAKAICLDECAQSGEEGARRLKKVKKSTGLYSKFTWATGGHSASAGHGNFFRESYTANMDRALTPILKGVGVDFEARNYAMGGTDSAEEVALCMNSIFGRDVDAISWDYGMTDGHDLWKMSMYAYKAAGISKAGAHRPAWFAIHQNPGNNLVVQQLQQLGMTTLAWNQDFMHNTVVAPVPDMFGMSEKEIEKIPSHLKYLKCDGQIEVGDPGCKDNKFNNTMCTKRKARTSWHPGWKMHALVGNLMAMTILDGLEDAIQILMAAQVPDETEPETKARLGKMLKALDKDEKKRYDNIFQAPMPEALQAHLAKWWPGEHAEHLSDLEQEAFYKEPSLCHTAILPSQQRFQGLVTENFTMTGDILDQNYDTGVSGKVLSGIEAPSRRANKEAAAYINPDGEGKLLLVKDDGGRQPCEDYLNLDYKDYFQVSNIEGWQSLTLPNKSQKKEYTEFDAKKSKGYILACLVRCDWGKCPGGDLHNHFGWKKPAPKKGEEPPTAEELAKIAKVEITINGEKMTEASNMHTCLALKNKRGHVWKPDADGQYEIKMRVVGGEGYAYLRVSSFVLV